MEEFEKIFIRGDNEENIVNSNDFMDAIKFHKTTYLI